MRVPIVTLGSRRFPGGFAFISLVYGSIFGMGAGIFGRWTNIRTSAHCPDPFRYGAPNCSASQGSTCSQGNSIFCRNRSSARVRPMLTAISGLP